MLDLHTSGVDSGIHPYNFFDAALHIGDNDYTVMEDGWLRLRADLSTR